MYLWEKQTGTPFWLLPVALCVFALGIFQIVRLTRQKNRLREAAKHGQRLGDSVTLSGHLCLLSTKPGDRAQK